MKKFLMTLGLVLSLSLFPFGSAFANNGNIQRVYTVVLFEDGTYQRFDGCLTDAQVIEVYRNWYAAHPEYGPF